MSKRRIVQERKTAKTIDKKNSDATHTAKGWNNMTNWLTVLVFVLPILFSRVTLDPAITVRYIFLSVFILLFILFFYAYKKINFVLTTPVKIVFALGIGFGIWSIISLFSAINPSAGYYEATRHFLNIILLFLVFAAVQKEEMQLLKICKAILLMSLLQSFVGILQFYDIAFSNIPGANAKPFGLMANRNLFGSAQALVLPFVIYVSYKAVKGWKYISFIALTGILVSIIISQTRSAWISTLAIFCVSLFLIIIFSKANRKKWIIGSAIAIICITGLVIFLFASDKDGALSTSIKERISINPTAKNATESVNANERLKIWGKTVELTKDHPIFGVGTGNWKLLIPHYGSEGLAWANGSFVPDRPHNVYLQISSETGIPGAILYFGMWLVIAIIAFMIIIKKNQSEEKKIIVILMLSGLAGFASDCMFSFPAERIEHSLYITLMGGIILGLYHNSQTRAQQKKQHNKFLVAIILLITSFNLLLGIKKYSFEIHMNLASAYNNVHRYQEVIDETEMAKNSFITIDQIGKSPEIYSSLAYKELKDYDNAIKEALTAKKHNPNSAMVYNNIGTIYTDMKKYDSAVNNYLQAIKLTPHFDILYKNLAVNYFDLGNYSACIEALSKVEEKDQDSTYLNSLLTEAKRRLVLPAK